MGDLRTNLNADRAAVARQLERERNRPVDEPMSADAARKLTDRIKFDAEQLWDKVTAAYLGRADIALGYESWDAYCEKEFKSLRLKLPREERREVVWSLRDSGLSDRAIESATGVSRRTLIRDRQRQSGGDNVTTSSGSDEDALAERLITVRVGGRRITHQPIRVRHIEQPKTEPQTLTLVTGLDGKKYTASKPLAEPKPLPSDAEIFDQQLTDLGCAVDVMTRLIDGGQLSEDERILLAGRVADYTGQLQVIARKLQDQITS